MDEQKIPRFFLGTATPSGFCSLFETMYDPESDWRCVLLKGGPGSGKSTLLRKAAARALESELSVELIYCSSDPRSLDAIILPDAHKCMADGTAPHVLEPKFPGVCETLFNPGDCWDASFLFAHRDEIRELCADISARHRRAVAIRSVVNALLEESCQMVRETVVADRLSRYLTRLCRRIFRGRPRAAGHEEARFLSGITPMGFVLFDQTLSCYADHIALIADDYGAIAPQILGRIRDEALAHGCRVISCHSPFHPEELDAVILPELGQAYATENTLLRYSAFLPERTIHSRRFLNVEALSTMRTELRFRRRTALMLLEDVYSELHEALRLHDQLEQYYKAAMDFDQLNEMTAALLDWFLYA